MALIEWQTCLQLCLRSKVWGGIPWLYIEHVRGIVAYLDTYLYLCRIILNVMSDYDPC